MHDDEFESWLSPSRRKPAAKLRNGPVVPPHVCENSARLPSLAIVQPGDTVELNMPTQDHDFLVIKHIIRDIATDTITLRGLRLRRNAYAKGVLPLKLNEVYMVLDADYDDKRPVLEQAMVDVPVKDAIKKRELTLTNRDYPADIYDRASINDGVHGKEARRDFVRHHLQLTCRWMHIIYYQDSIARDKTDQRRRHCETWERVAKTDCDHGSGRPESELKRQFRIKGDMSNLQHESVPRYDNVRGPASNRLTLHPRTNGTVIRSRSVKATPRQLVDLTISDDTTSSPVAPCKSGYKQGPSTPSRKRSYEESHSTSAARVVPDLYQPTSGPAAKRHRPDEATPRRLTVLDTFCGGGGVSRGAVQAGFDIVEAFDQDHDACTTYRANFPWVEPWELSAHEFVKVMQNSNYFVDVVHFSFPCQAFSRMNRTRYTDTDRNNENRDAATCLELILHLRRPRVVTIEQTDGLLDFPQHFNSLLRMLVDCGYSVRWKVMRLEEYGLPQKRR